MNCLDCKHCIPEKNDWIACSIKQKPEIGYNGIGCFKFTPKEDPIQTAINESVGTTKPDRHAAICAELNDLYRRKNADYGDSFGKSWDEEGYHAFTVRGGDKMNRIKQLFKNEAKVSDESIIDTLRDLANYCIMSIMELEARK